MTRPEITEQRLLTSFEPDADTGCWVWTQPLERGGYARFYDHGYRKAHRVMYERVVGQIPDGLTLDHLCRNRACVNPSHLEPVTLAENIRRGNSPAAINGRKARCHRGHPFTQGATQRYCRTCRVEREAVA